MSFRKLLLPVLLGLFLLPTQALGQGFNGRARTYISYLQLRDLVLDSLEEGTVPGDGVQRTLSNGTPVTCGEDYCQYYRSGPELGVAPFLVDLELNAWSGITGLRGYAHVRARDHLGDYRIVWPRADEPFEALAAYIEYGRSFYRIRAGRQWQTTALGLYNYDGGSVHMGLPHNLDLEVYGGISLLRGLNESHYSDLISDVESLFPKEDAWLGGAHLRVRPFPALSGSITYQREEATNSGDLYSERLAASTRILLGPLTLSGELKYDLATRQTNLAKAALAFPMGHGFRASGQVRRYKPFFELWTIWGAFSPVGFDEVRGRLDWIAPTGKLSGYTYGSYRTYDVSTTQIPESLSITDESWRWGLGGRYSLRTDVTLSAEYRYDEGYGASRNGGDLSVQKFFGRDSYVALRGTAFQTFSEFRVGSGGVIGGGLEGAFPLASARVRGSGMFYRHDQIDRRSLLDLNQTRLSLSLEVPIGNDPGLRGGGN
ncbi:MAG: hypothetical protein HKO65_18795 [Gemmatimonadetes bacterium]|nr:hypothetical protein [Gemmatimonadota bacterium]NNM07148.1 hypothetical protein [Gemmatimonadota bacterium]